MWVRRVAKCPPARVAIQPPSVDSSNDCGKKRSVRPCAASCSSIRGPLAPAPMRAARETSSTSRTLVDRPEVDRDRAVEAVGHARLDAADDARPAAVRDDRRVRARPPTRARPRSRARRAGARRRRARARSGRAGRGRCRGRTGRGRGAARTRGVDRADPARCGGRLRRAAAGSAVGSNGDGLLGLGLAEAEQPDEARARPRARRPSRSRRPRIPSPSGCARACGLDRTLREPMRALPPSSPAARGRPTTCRRAGATSTTRRRPSAARRPTPRSRRCASAGSPSHDGLAARLVGHERARRRARARPAAACAGRCASSRATRRARSPRCA